MSAARRPPEGGDGDERSARSGAARAEPLRARWRPPTRRSGSKRGGSRGRSKLGRALETYGWRAYALPALLALTVVVVLNMLPAPDKPVEKAAASKPSSPPATSSGEPLATPSPVNRVPLDIPTAELPAGGDYTHDGAGEWRILPGTTPVVGTGQPVLSYTIEVEVGIDPSSYGGDDAFVSMVEDTLSDPRGWIGHGMVSFKRVDADGPPPDFRIRLTTPTTIEGPCGGTIDYEVSCHEEGWPDANPVDAVYINLARWVRGAMAYNGALGLYRRYAINHEVGHHLGLGHKRCLVDGRLAPVMMQQTFGVANNVVAKISGSVPANGNVCKPNPWPYPQARPAE